MLYSISSMIGTPVILFILAIPLALIIGYLFLLRPYLGTYFFILSFPFIALLPRGAIVPGFKLDELLIVVILLCYFVSPGTKKVRSFFSIDYIMWALLFAAILIPSIGIVVRGESLELGEIIAPLKVYLIFRLILMTMNDRKRIYTAIILLLIPTIFISIIAFLQMLNIGPVRNLLVSIYDTSATQSVNYFRATATLGDWNSLGAYSVLCACLSLAIIPRRQEFPLPWLPILALAASVMSIILSGSTNSIVGFILGFIMWFCLLPRKKMSRNRLIVLIAILFAFVIAYFSVGKTVIATQLTRQSAAYIYDRATGTYYDTNGFPASMVTRWALAKYLFGVISNDKMALITGFGTGQGAIALLPWGTPESGYMAMLFYYGPVYLVVYFFLLWFCYVWFSRYRKRIRGSDSLGYVLATAGLLFIVTIGIMNIMHVYYVSAGVMHYFWIVIALVLAHIYISKKTPQIEVQQ